MAKKSILVVSHDEQGEVQELMLDSVEELVAQYEQVGIDDCSTDLALRGFPVVRGLVGPIPESKTVARYESASVFEANTKVWAATRIKRRRRTRAAIEAEMLAAQQAEEAGDAGDFVGKPHLHSVRHGSPEHATQHISGLDE